MIHKTINHSYSPMTKATPYTPTQQIGNHTDILPTQDTYIIMDTPAHLIHTLGYMRDDEATIRPYPSVDLSISNWIPTLSINTTLLLIKERDTLSNRLQSIALTLNQGIKIIEDITPIHLSPLYTVTGIHTHHKNTIFIPNTIQLSTYPMREHKESHNVECKPTRENTAQYDEEVLMSRTLGELYPIHREYFNDREREVTIHTKEEIDNTREDTHYWNSILSEEGLGLNMEMVVAQSTFTPCDFEENKEVTKEDRELHIKEVTIERRSNIRATTQRLTREKREEKRALITPKNKRRRERAIPPSQR